MKLVGEQGPELWSPLGACCSCGGDGLDEVLDLGPMYLSDFVEPGEPRGVPWPLRLMLCPSCTLLQLAVHTPRPAVFHERYGYKSGINEAAVQDLADTAAYALDAIPSPRTWLDIGCNDGSLLAAVPKSVYRVGVDPLTQFADEALRHADRIVSDYFSPGLFDSGEFDVVTSAAMFYDLDDPSAFVHGVGQVLAPHGAWVIQQNYALDMLRNNVVDNICHEHVTYFSVRSLANLLGRNGLQINDVTYSCVKGGCIRTLVSRTGDRPVLNSVYDALRLEREAGLDDPWIWRKWGEDVRDELDKTRQLALDAEATCQRIYIYGASTRGGTFLQMIGASPDLFPFAVERNPDKVGKVMTSTGIPIISEDEMRADPPDYLLISPWFFRSTFVEREKAFLDSGRHMIFPLPKFEVV